jgi:hypothetical protein
MLMRTTFCLLSSRGSGSSRDFPLGAPDISARACDSDAGPEARDRHRYSLFMA